MKFHREGKMKWSLDFKEHNNENMVKKIRGTKLKVLVQGLHMIHVSFVLVITSKFVFQIPNLIYHVKYKYILIIN